jgi:aminocarboxymuconate-semialdehyde decarboxylase
VIRLVLCCLSFSGHPELFSCAGRIEHGFNVRPDLVAVDNAVNPREYCGRFWLDSLVHDPVALRLVAETVGADRIVLGSDFPFPLGEACPGELVESMADWSTEQKAKVLWNNALDWLGKKEFPSSPSPLQAPSS